MNYNDLISDFKNELQRHYDNARSSLCRKGIFQLTDSERMYVLGRESLCDQLLDFLQNYGH